MSGSEFLCSGSVPADDLLINMATLEIAVTLSHTELHVFEMAFLYDWYDLASHNKNRRKILLLH